MAGGRTGRARIVRNLSPAPGRPVVLRDGSGRADSAVPALSISVDEIATVLHGVTVVSTRNDEEIYFLLSTGAGAR
jgi:hypothetical protein